MKITMYLEEGADPTMRCSKCETERSQCRQFYFLDQFQLCEICYTIYVTWDPSYKRLKEFLSEEWGSDSLIAKKIIHFRKIRTRFLPRNSHDGL